ncbi:hypothetical protein SARC_11410, partial [Sphaeroforma arctica JP610]
SHRLSYGGGSFQVYVQGSTANPAIVTFHDAGLEHKSCFGGLFNYELTQKMMEDFCVYHIDAPGCETGAGDLLGTTYPSVEELAGVVHKAVEHFSLPRFVAMGSGIGCNVFLQYTQDYIKTKVMGMILFSPVITTCGWYEWSYYKTSLLQARTSGYHMTSHLRDLFLYRYFGDRTVASNMDLVQIFEDYLSTETNVRNAIGLTESYLRRPDQTKIAASTSCRTLIVTGSDSPVLNDVVYSKGKFPSDNSSWQEVSACGSLVHEEVPQQIASSLRLFLMGLSYPIGTLSKLSQLGVKQ